jgi:hypothetical protein
MKYFLSATLVALVLAGCGGEVDPARTGAGSAQVRFFEDLYGGKFANVYATLHPAHQKWVPKMLFVRCARQSIAVHKLDSIEILDVYDDPVRVPGLGKLRAKAVRVRLTSSTGETFTVLNHEVRDGSRWRWVLNAPAIRAYRSGTCPRSTS